MKVLWSLAMGVMMSCGTGLVHASEASRQAGYLYLSPVPGAPYVAPQTRYVLVRFENLAPAEVTNLSTSFLTVTGASSGVHPGQVQVASDGRTVMYQMSEDFTLNEVVTVRLDPRLAAGAGGSAEVFEYQFAINAPMPGSLPPPSAAGAGPVVEAPEPGEESIGEGSVSAASDGVGEPRILPNGVSVPSGFPQIEITVNQDPSPGYLFLYNPGMDGRQYTMMLDNQGSPVWYEPTLRSHFTVQKNSMITWMSTVGTFTGSDEDFDHLRNFRAVNGYSADVHEFQIQEDGSYFILGKRWQKVDMTLYLVGANPAADVGETVIQEFTAAGELIFQWRAWDHFDIREVQYIDPLGATISFPHINALDIDADGQLLISSRHLSEVTKIDRDSGEILWRLGGAHNEFTFLNDPLGGFSCQHDISALGDNHYMVFDNGDLRAPHVSRAVEYALDPTNRTATLVWQFRDTPDKYTHYMGNAQRLPNGNTLINFVLGQYPKAVEVDGDGVKQFEMNVFPESDLYRATRFPWEGKVSAPCLIAEPQEDNVTLIFNKFGDGSVDHYRIYGGTSPAPTNVVATSTRTLIHLTNIVNRARNYFRVTALDTNGVESAYSNEANLRVYLLQPGQNLVLNGDFSQGTNAWVCEATGSASVQWTVTNEASRCDLASGGSYLSDVQLWQAGMHLVQGKEYALEFDAWAAEPRLIEAKVTQNSVAGLNYSGIQPLTISPVRKRYRFIFTMGSPSDFDARLLFNVGVLPVEVWIDEVSLVLREYAPGDFNRDGCVGVEDLKVLAGEWKREQGGLTSDLNGDGRVDFADFTRFAQHWAPGGVCH